MNNKKAKQLKRLSLQITNGYKETEYDVGIRPEFNTTGKSFTFQGKKIMPGRRVLAGKPTMLKTNCTRYVYKQLKANA